MVIGFCKRKVLALQRSLQWAVNTELKASIIACDVSFVVQWLAYNFDIAFLHRLAVELRGVVDGEESLELFRTKSQKGRNQQ